MGLSEELVLGVVVIGAALVCWWLWGLRARLQGQAKGWAALGFALAAGLGAYVCAGTIVFEILKARGDLFWLLPLSALATSLLAVVLYLKSGERSAPAPARAAAVVSPPAAAPAKPARPLETADVFISYKRDERAEVEAIARAFEALKLKVWFDAELRSGTSFDQEIERQVRSARCVLVCWSPGAVASDWVRAEATIGRQRDVLAAVMLRPCDLPPPFNLVHAENLTSGPAGEGWLRVLERVGGLTGRPGLAAFALALDGAALGAWIAANGRDPLVDIAIARLRGASA